MVSHCDPMRLRFPNSPRGGLRTAVQFRFIVTFSIKKCKESCLNPKVEYFLYLLTFIFPRIYFIECNLFVIQYYLYLISKLVINSSNSFPCPFFNIPSIKLCLYFLLIRLTVGKFTIPFLSYFHCNPILDTTNRKTRFLLIIIIQSYEYQGLTYNCHQT